MKYKIYSLVIMLFCSISLFGQNPGQTDQIILKLKKEVTSSSGLLCNKKKTGNEKVDGITLKYHALKVRAKSLGKDNDQHIYILQFPQGTNIQQVIEEYYKTGEIEYAEPDYKGKGSSQQGFTPNDQFYVNQWSMKNDGSFPLSPAIAGADIDMENAWAIEQGDSSIIVGIIDSGCKLDHPEFTGRIWTNHSEIPNNGLDDDGNNYVDDSRGWDFAYNTNNPMDLEGHGTNVAGIIGANGNNAIGYAGVDWNCQLMIIRGLDSNGWGYYSWWAEAMYYAVDNGARVINMSLEGSSSSSTLQAAADYAFAHNVLVVACMGNENSSSPDYPGACNNVMAVGSTNANDTRSNPFFWSPTSGSNFGSHISVVAPGNFIYGLDYLSDTQFGSYWGGTSQATPHVAGLSALMLAQNPSLTPAQIKSIIETTSEDQVGDASEDTPGWDQYYGHGRINAFNALSYVTKINPDLEAEQSLVVYPNPAHENFLLKIPSGAKQIRVINVFGQCVESKIIQGQTLLHLQMNDSGIYTILVDTGKKILSSKIIVYN